MPHFKGSKDPEALNDAAGQLCDKGANADARSLYSRAYLAALSWRNLKAACHALAGLAWCALVDRDPSVALALATTCKDVATQAGNLHYRASALIICARVALIRRDLEEAESCALEAAADGKKDDSVVRYDA